MSSDGKLTAEAAIFIAEKLRGSEYEVLFDHGSSLKVIPPDVKVGHIVSWSGEKRGSQLAHLDIVIAEKGSRKTMALIEIEEKDDNPKTFLGDSLAMLIGKKMTFDRKPLLIGNWTTMLVLGKRTLEQETKSLHKKRIEYLDDVTEFFRQTLETENSRVKNVKLGTFVDGPDLHRILLEEFDHLILRK